jgi:hypothetical protein
MVEVTLDDEMVVFNVKGWHKLWALKSNLIIPRAHILGAQKDPSVFEKPKGWRVPGTNVPGLIAAGTFHVEGKSIFWDVNSAENIVVIDLADEDYNQLIIEVENPDSVISMLSNESR